MRQAVEIFCLQRFAAEIRQQLAAAVGDVDRAAEAKLGLVEQKRKGVFGDHGISTGPSENTLAQRHRMNAELAESDALEFAVSGMVLDPLHVAAETVALVQD